MADELKINVSHWLHNKKKLAEIIKAEKELRDKINAYETRILKHMSRNGMENSVINIGNNEQLSFSYATDYENITKKYMIDKLETYYRDKSQAKQVVDYLYKNRGMTKKAFLNKKQKPLKRIK